MASTKEYVAKSEELLMPIMEANGFELVDVEFVKEGANYYLRAYVDKPGGFNINDCELVSRAFEAKLDEINLIEEPYILEVSSPGLTRPLKKDKDFKRYLDKEVEIHLFKPINKRKEFAGVLKAFDAESITIEEFDDGEMQVARKDISLARPYIEF